MAFFNNYVAILLISNAIFLSKVAAYSSIEIPPLSSISYISSSPDASPAPAPKYETYVLPAGTFVPIEEQGKDSHFLETNMVAGINQLEQFVTNVVTKKLNDPSIDPSSKACLLVCEEVYENGVDALKKGMESVSSGNFYKANVDVSAFTSNIDACDECFNEIIEPEFVKFDEWARGVANNCLDKIAKYTA